MSYIKFGAAFAMSRFLKQYAARDQYHDKPIFMVYGCSETSFINSIMDCYNKYKAVEPVDPVQLKSLMSPLDESYGELLLSHISNLKSQLQKARYELDKLNSK